MNTANRISSGCKYPVYAVVQAQTESVKKRVEAIPPNTLLNASERDLAQALIEELRFDVPVIKDEDFLQGERSGAAQTARESGLRNNGYPKNYKQRLLAPSAELR